MHYSTLMRLALRFVALSILAKALTQSAFAQDLAPRAYVITPVHSNALTLSYGFYDGNLDFGNIPIANARASASVPVLSFFHSMSLFGHTASLVASLPYGIGNFRGTVLNAETNVYRSGLLDSVYRFSVNLKGGPAMSADQYRGWHQKTIVGVSVRLVAPTGQYDSPKLVNWGNNRWAFKPELGFSRRSGHWIIDAYGGAWLYTANPEFFSRNQYNRNISRQTQAPVGALEAHLSYDVRPRFWASLDGNFWFGGKTRLNGVENPATELRSSRVGGTVSIPVSKHHSVKLSYSNGAYIKYGGNFRNVSVAWQYSWLHRPN
jgi:hypothetical protein